MCKAQFDYTAAEQGELSLKEGESIYVLSYQEGGAVVWGVV